MAGLVKLCSALIHSEYQPDVGGVGQALMRLNLISAAQVDRQVRKGSSLLTTWPIPLLCFNCSSGRNL